VVKASHLVAGCLITASVIIGTLSDKSVEKSAITLGGYQVLAADFHIHTFPLSWGVLSPWDTVTEARRQGLDAIALTPHNHTWVAKVGRWFSTIWGGPIVIVGEEIHSSVAGYHLIALGITNTITWNQQATSAVDEVHKQGGVAIAAHPITPYAGYNEDVIQKLDGAEVVHPLALRDETLASQLREFFARRRWTAIGDTDYHLGPMSPYVGTMGLCRTYVFVHSRTEQGILDALREGHTVVYDRDHVYGDPALIQLAAEDSRLPKLASSGSGHESTRVVSAICGLLGLLTIALSRRERVARSAG
jgi:hypothetical protein